MNTAFLQTYFQINRGYQGHFIPEILGYVTDGLIHMWDGEYNLRDKHSSTTELWMDLVGGVDLPWIDAENGGEYDWQAKCCHFHGASGTERFWVQYPENSGTLQLESAVSPIAVPSRNTNSYPVYNCEFMMSSRATYMQSNTRTSDPSPRTQNSVSETSIQYGLFNSVTGAKGSIHTLSAATTHRSPISSIYMDGTAYRGTLRSESLSPLPRIWIGGGWSSTQGAEAAVYCCRVYNRALTAAEIQQNYLVDKARFGTSYT